MQFNKIFAAILIAGIVAMIAGILSEEIYHVPKLKQDAFPVAALEGAATAAPAAEVPLEPIAPLLAKASAENGEKVAKVCAACHSFDKGGPNKVGPNLWNTVNNKHGHADGYAYSEAIAKMPGKWDSESLNAFLHAPKKYAPGTKMGFAGLNKAQDRADIIKYLETLK